MDDKGKSLDLRIGQKYQKYQCFLDWGVLFTEVTLLKNILFLSFAVGISM
jgi:hypothetical protein